MADNHSAVNEIIKNIPHDTDFHHNEIKKLNQIFNALDRHGYDSELKELKERIISETRTGASKLPTSSSIHEWIVSLTGVDQNLEDDLPGEF